MTFYEVVVTPDKGGDVAVRASQVFDLTTTVDHLTPGTEYRVDVVAWNESGGGTVESKKLKTAKAGR